MANLQRLQRRNSLTTRYCLPGAPPITLPLLSHAFDTARTIDCTTGSRKLSPTNPLWLSLSPRTPTFRDPEACYATLPVYHS